MRRSEQQRRRKRGAGESRPPRKEGIRIRRLMLYGVGFMGEKREGGGGKALPTFKGGGFLD